MRRIVRSLALGTASLALLLLGCDNSGVGKTVPVVGKITVNGEPLTLETTTVVFRPDKAKGNASEFEAVGQADEEGTYTLSTKGKGGAPPGWYQVEVFATMPRQGSYKKKAGPPPTSAIDAKYNSAKTSGLALEVVENPNPGAYDLALTKSDRPAGRGSPHR